MVKSSKKNGMVFNQMLFIASNSCEFHGLANALIDASIRINASLGLPASHLFFNSFLFLDAL